MAETENQLMQFLTREESAAVDTALLASRDKFAVRLAIYALRSLQQISQVTGLPVTEINENQIINWIENDKNIQQQIELDASFKLFFTRLVLSAINPLEQISQEKAVPIPDLTVKQVIAWFEKDRKITE